MTLRHCRNRKGGKMTVKRRLERLEGRAAIGRGGVAVGWVEDATQPDVITVGGATMTRAEFMAQPAASHVLVLYVDESEGASLPAAAALADFDDGDDGDD